MQQSNSTNTIKVLRLGVHRKDGHDKFRYELRNGDDVAIASISGRFSQFQPFSEEAVKLFPWLALAPLVNPLIPMPSIPDEVVEDRFLKIQFMLFVISNGVSLAPRREQQSDDNSPLKFLLSRKELVVNSNTGNESLQGGRFASPSAPEIDNLIATTTTATNIPSSTFPSSHILPQQAYEHQNHFDLSRFSSHVQAWNFAVCFTENLEREITSLKANFERLAKEVYKDLYETTLDGFSEASKRLFVECGAFSEEDMVGSTSFGGDDDDDDERVDNGNNDNTSNGVHGNDDDNDQEPTLTPAPRRPNANDDDDDDANNNHHQSPKRKQKETPTLVVEGNSHQQNERNQQRAQHPLNQLVTIGAMYNLRGDEAIPKKVVEVAGVILPFVEGAKALAKRRRDAWTKMYQTLLEAHKFEIAAENNLNASTNGVSPPTAASASSTTSPTSQPPLPTETRTNNNNRNLNNIMSHGNRNSQLVSSASLIRGATNRHESEASFLKEMIRSSSEENEKLFDTSFRNFRIMFEKMWNEELIPNIAASVMAKPKEV